MHFYNNEHPENDPAYKGLSVKNGVEKAPMVNPYWQHKISRHQYTASEFVEGILAGDISMLSQALTLVESSLHEHQVIAQEVIEVCLPHAGNSIRLGITGVPGAGKSTFIEALGIFLVRSGHKLAVLAIDPSSERSKGSILGDKTRMEELSVNRNAFIRPSPSAGSLGGVARKTRESIILCEAAGFDTIFVETVGVGQSETSVHSMVDFFLLIQIAGAGDIQKQLQITGAASVTAIGVGQRIEQNNSYDLVGHTCTLSVDLANSVLTTVTWTASYATTTANTFGTIGTPTKTQIATGTFTVNSTVTNYQASIAVPAAATTGIEVIFRVGAQTSGTWTLGSAQLEKGAVKTDYDFRDYGRELQMCQRYLPSFVGCGNGYCYIGQCVNPSVALFSLPFFVSTFAAATAIVIANNNTAAIKNANNTGFLSTNIAFQGATLTSAALEIDIGSASLVAGNASLADIAGIGLYFTGCEIP